MAAAKNTMAVHEKVGYILAAILGAGAVAIVSLEAISGGVSFDRLASSWFPHCLAFAAWFGLTGKVYWLRLAQPTIALIIGLASEILEPYDPSFVPFLLVAVSLYFKYGFFDRQLLARSLLIIAFVAAAGVVGACLPQNQTLPPIAPGFAYLIRVPFTTVCLLVIELGIFYEDLRPALFPPKILSFFVMDQAGLTPAEARVLDMVLNPNATLHSIALSTKVSDSTVKNTLQSIYRKLGCGHTRPHLMEFLSGHIVIWTETDKARFTKVRTGGVE